MKLKAQTNLIPTAAEVDSVVVYDNNDNPIFAAIHILGEAIAAARIGEADFPHVLKLIGNDVCPKVSEISPSPARK